MLAVRIFDAVLMTAGMYVALAGAANYSLSAVAIGLLGIGIARVRPEKDNYET